MASCEHCHEMESTRKQIADMHHIIMGNGDPAKGLAYKVAQHAEFVAFWKRFGWVVLGAFSTVPPAIVVVIVLNLMGMNH